MSRFLRFVVEETISGRGSELKETLIGVRVFDKPASYDPNTDSTVRVEASKLRGRLARYYESDGTDDTLTIEIPKGGYVPRFEVQCPQEKAPAGPVEAPIPEQAPVPIRSSLPSIRTLREAIAWCIVAGFVVTYLVGATHAGGARNSSTTLRFQIWPPSRAKLPQVTEVGPAVLSPDSSSLAFVADVDSRRMLYLRRLDQVAPQPLPGTEGAKFPFWSQDGKSLGYFAGTHLMRIDIDTGLVKVLADAPSGRGGAWSSEDTILFAPDLDAPLFAFPVGGGRPTQVTRLRPGEVSHQQPSFSRNGSEFLYVAKSRESAYAQLYHADLTSAADPVALAATDSAGYVIGNEVVRVRAGQLIGRMLGPGPPLLSGLPRELGRNLVSDDSITDFSITARMIVRRSTEDYWTLEVVR
jgi:hypothetical protein